MTSDLINVKVRLFGPSVGAVGRDELDYALVPPATLAVLHELLSVRYPAIAAAGTTLRFAVNRKYAAMDAQLHEGDEVAVIPPVSGG